MPLGDDRAVPEAAVLFGQRDQRAILVATSRPTGLDQQHQRKQAEYLRLVGHQFGEDAAQTDRLPGEFLPGEAVARSGRVTLVEDEIDDRERRAETIRQFRVLLGTRYGMPASRIFVFARLMRWAIVVSGTTKARAISPVVSPPSSRSVRANRAGGASAGWQQVKIRRRRSSCTAMTSSGSACWNSCAAWAWRSSRVASRRNRSTILRRGRRDDPAGRAGRQALGRPPLRGDDERFLHALFGEIDVAERPNENRHGTAVFHTEDFFDVALAPSHVPDLAQLSGIS